MRLARWILDFAHLVVFKALDVKPLSCSLPRLPFMEGDTHVKVEIFRYVRFRDFFALGSSTLLGRMREINSFAFW